MNRTLCDTWDDFPHLISFTCGWSKCVSLYYNLQDKLQIYNSHLELGVNPVWRGFCFRGTLKKKVTNTTWINAFEATDGSCSDLLEDLRLLLQAAVQVAAGVHAEILHHHLIDQFLQLAQLGAQMSEGRIHRQSHCSLCGFWLADGVTRTSCTEVTWNEFHGAFLWCDQAVTVFSAWIESDAHLVQQLCVEDKH